MSAAKRDPWANAVATSATLASLLIVTELVIQFQPRLLNYGIRPRTGIGLIGIVCCPLLHAGLAHLAANLIPLFVLVILLFADPKYQPKRTLCWIWLLSGLGTWLIGRTGTVNVGASGVIYGLVTYLVVAGLRMRSWRAAVVALIVLLLYGGAIYGLLPQPGPISWEGHLSGAVAGIGIAMRHHR